MSSGEKESAKIRPLTRKDVFPVLTMLKKTGWRGTLTERDLRDYVLRGHYSLSFVAEVEGQVIGVLLGRFIHWGAPVAEMGAIQVLAVDPDYQRRHSGSKLVNAVFDRCFAEGVGTVRADIDERYWELKIFAENMGFRPSGLIEYTRNVEV